MSGDPALAVDLAIQFVSIAFLALGGYIGFKLSRIQGSRIYNRRALWMGICSLGLIPTFVQVAMLDLQDLFFLVPCTPPSSQTCINLPVPWFLVVQLTQYYANPLALGVFFAFVFTTIRVVVEQDYLHRNNLRWQNLKWFVLIALEGTVVLRFAAFQFFGLVFNFDNILMVKVTVTSAGAGVDRSVVSTTSPVIFALDAFNLALGTYLALVLLVGSIRTPDSTMKTYSAWIGFGVVSTLFSLGIASYIPDGFGGIPLVIATFCWYRAASSLSPISRKREI